MGHILTPQGTRPTDRLLTAIQKFERPTNASDVKSFVHLAGFYRKFVEGFARRASPLSKLTRHDVAWTWGPEQESAFEDLKSALVSKPVLVYPDFGKPFVVATDASQVGLGAVLMQDQGQGLQPVAYASTTCSTAESKYGVSELECLAMVWGLDQFRPYVYGRPITLVDNQERPQRASAPLGTPLVGIGSPCSASPRYGQCGCGCSVAQALRGWNGYVNSLCPDSGGFIVRICASDGSD